MGLGRNLNWHSFFEKTIQFKGPWPLKQSQISRTESPEWRNPNQQSLWEPRVDSQYGKRRPKSRAECAQGCTRSQCHNRRWPVGGDERWETSKEGPAPAFGRHVLLFRVGGEGEWWKDQDTPTPDSFEHPPGPGHPRWTLRSCCSLLVSQKGQNP